MEPERTVAKKRTPDEIILPKPKKLRTDDGKRLEALALIDHILEQRGNVQRVPSVQRSNFNDCILTHLPPVSEQSNFLPLTNIAGDRLYLKIAPENSLESSERNSAQRPANEEMWSSVYDTLEKIRERPVHNERIPDVRTSSTVTRLWADVYKPTEYKDLLSEEHTNRVLLRWIKLWDAFVFKKSRTKKTKVPIGHHHHHAEEFFEQDKADHRPKYKLVLLCGPPGVGKTTMAHVVARHAGYKPMEVNASEERTLEAFRNVLVNATTNTSITHHQTPNCLIFDEIDGAPATSIDFLVKFAADQYGRTAKGAKRVIKLQRPIICICNNAYVTALRPLRQAALVVHVGGKREAAAAADGGRLLARLVEIADKEGVRISRTALMTLVEKSGHDMRTCLTNLQFYRAPTASSVCTMHAGLKDVQRSMFQCWENVFFLAQRSGRGRNADVAARWQAIVEAMRRSGGVGEFEKLAIGVFENYTRLCTAEIGTTAAAGIGSLADALDWFCVSDVWNRHIHETQQYAMSAYLMYAFVMWHFVFATLPKSRGTFEQGAFKRIQYPHVGLEVHQARQKSGGILNQILRFMSPSIRSQYSSPQTTLQLDVLPMLLRLLANPALRPVDRHLFTPKERATLALVVNVMIDYGLNYLQERAVDGNYTFRMDPNFEELVTFASIRASPAPDVRYQSKALAVNSNRQLIALEIGVEKMRRMTHLTKPGALPAKPASGKTEPAPKKVNYFLVKATTTGRGETSVQRETGRLLTAEKRNKGVFFQYREGHTNAVRRAILISELRL